ncbi:MAG: hypothetical protein AAFV19_14595 [Pseudomonadota bacterium]
MTDTTTRTLTEAEQQILRAVLDTVVPASADGRMPSAAELDFSAYLAEQAAAFAASLPEFLAALPSDFASLGVAARSAALEEVAAADPASFDQLIFRVYDCYYQNDAVRLLIGGEPGPPFPRGNTIPQGDLSSLDAVIARSPGYRRV